MSKTDKLYQLIKSMDKSEKGFFKKFTSIYSKKGDSNYLKLYDALSEMQTYDESLLEKKFENTKLATQLAVNKKYLFDNLLWSLRLYQKGHSIRRQAEQLRNEAEVLWEHGLHDEAFEHLEKAKIQANRIEGWLWLSDILQTEVSWRKSLEQSELLRRVENEYERISTILKKEAFYLNCYEKTFTYRKKEEVFRNSEEESFITADWWEDERIQNIELADTHSAFKHFNNIQINLHRLKGDYVEAYKYQAAVYKNWQKNIDLIKEYPHLYFNALCNSINRALEMADLSEVSKLLAELKALKLPTLIQQIYQFERISLYELGLVELRQDFDDLDNIVKFIDRGMKKHNTQLHSNEMFIIFYNVTLLYTIKGDYDKALNWHLRLQNLPKQDILHNTQRFAKVLQIVIHLSLGHLELVSSALNSFRRHLQNNEKLYQYEKLLLKFAQEATDRLFLYGNRNWIETYILQFEALKEDPFEKNIFWFFDIIVWLKALFSKTTMLHIIKSSKP